MKKLLLILAFLAFNALVYAQSPFGSKQSISTNTGNYPKVIESGKINNDAYSDIVIGTFVGGTIEWYKNNGNGTFTLQALVSSTLPRVNGLAIADMDNDNDNDIIATSYSLGQVVWYKNNGNGSFGSAQVIASGLTDANTVKAGDIDGNNTMDVVVSSYSTNSVSWFSNNGSGSFGVAQAISSLSNSGPLDFDLADYDQDNDLDVVVAYGIIDAIVLFDNNLAQTGSPGFGTYYLVDSANYGLMDVRFGDVDNNGDLEIVKADQYANTAWYNKSGSSFTKTSFSTSNSSAAAIMVSDVDNDNVNDVVVGYSSTASTDKMTWYKNSSSSGELTIDNTQNDILSFIIDDFDNDGKPDMASVSTNENHLNWFKNIGATTPCNDSDNDGVCDLNDKCPGFDDKIDINNNGIPDGCEELPSCSEIVTNFSTNILTNSRTGTNSTTLTLTTGSQNVSFTINDIGEKTKGKAIDYYIERVTVTYKDNAGITITAGSYRGDQVSSATVNIPGIVQSVTVKLDDAYNGRTGSTMSVSLSSVTFCGIEQPNECKTNTSNFNLNPLTHSGSGSSSSSLTLSANSQNVSFTISGLEQKQKGRQDTQFIENVTVTYIDGTNVLRNYGTYSGLNINTAAININGAVKSITVSLSDELNGTSTISVNLSEITYCISSLSSSKTSSNKNTFENFQSDILNSNDNIEEESFKVYPNPVSNILFIKNSKIISNNTNISLYNINGTLVRKKIISNNNSQTQELNIKGLATGLYLLQIINEGGNLLKTERIIIK